MLPRIESQLKELENLVENEGGFTKYVFKHAPQLKQADAEAIAKMLDTRIDLIYDKVKKAKADILWVEQELAKQAANKALAAAAAAAANLAADKAAQEAMFAESSATYDPKNVSKADAAKAKKNAAARAKRAAAKAANAVPRKPIVFEELKHESVPVRPPKIPTGGKGMVEGRNASIEYRTQQDMQLIATNAEQSSITAFTEASSQYTDMRASVRMTPAKYALGSHNMTYEKAKEHVANINSAFEKRMEHRELLGETVADEIQEAYRGIRFLSKKQFDEMLNEQIIQWDAPTSTSWHPDNAKSFYSERYGESHSIYYRIKPAAKTAGMAVEGISDVKSEHEILFGNGVKFRVTKVVRDTEFNRGAIMYLEEIPQK
jgi:hypothetical protein